MEPSAEFLVELRDRVAVLTINRPERRNALTGDIVRRLPAALADVVARGARVAILKGAGGKAFCSGYEIGRLPVGEQKSGPRETGVEAASSAIEACPVPVIACIGGFAVGAGCELAVTCDLRIANESARIGITPAKLGLVYRPAGVARFLRTIGLPNTRELFYTAALVDARTALRMGLVNRVVADGQEEAAALELAHTIAANAPLSVSGAKRITSLLAEHALTGEAAAEAARLVEEAWTSRDIAEGRAAFLEKRSPDFTGS